MNKVQQIEVEWYRRNGNYGDRITKGKDGEPYVIGDWAWNRFYKRNEWIEHKINIPKNLQTND